MASDHSPAFSELGQYVACGVTCILVAVGVCGALTIQRSSWQHVPRSDEMIARRMIAHEKREMLASFGRPSEVTESLSAVRSR